MSTPDDDTPSTLDATLRRDGPADEVIFEGAVVGEYRVTSRLGAGAMGAVYAAWDPRLEREVALKVLHGGGDLLGEARLLAQLSHPNVVTVHEVREWQGRVVLVMELARGRTLRAWLREKKRTPAELRDVFTQCAQGLAAAHAKGIVHRDFKPDNVLIEDGGRARLLDFGLAIPASAGVAGLAGSPAYMALRQLEHAPADAASDQFSWWASLYEGLTGRLLHDAQSAPSLPALIARRREGALDLSGVPRAWRRALTRGLANDPAHRFPSMEAAARALAPARARWWAIATVIAAGLAVLLSRPTAQSPCQLADVPTSAWNERAREPALIAAVAAWRGAREACRAEPAELQQPTAACLRQAGLELDVALEALDTTPPFDPALSLRVLRRVMPAQRCLRQPLPPLVHFETDRGALVESLREHLRFEALRLADDTAGALALARVTRAKADRGASAAARVWAGFNEASALSAQGDAISALKLLGALQQVEGAGPREHAWVALGRWLFACYSSGQEQCETARRQAKRLVAEVDEPWLHAFEGEIAAQLDDDEGLDFPDVVRAWEAIPGAEWETQRALGAALLRVLTDRNLRLQRQLEPLLRNVTRPSARLRMLGLLFELQVAARAGELELARQKLEDLEALQQPERELRRAKSYGRLSFLTGFRRHAEALALVDGLDTSPGAVIKPYEKLTMQLAYAELADSPRYAELLEKVQLVEPHLSGAGAGTVLETRLRRALRLRDADELEALASEDDETLLREWQLAITRGDQERERAAYRAAHASPEVPAAKVLEAWEAFYGGDYQRALELARAQQDQAPTDELLGNLQLLEAGALWHLEDRERACAGLAWQLDVISFAYRERALLDKLFAACPAPGGSAAAAP